MWVSKEVSANLRQPNEASSIGEGCSHVPQASPIIPGTPVSPFLPWLSITALYKGTQKHISMHVKDKKVTRNSQHEFTKGRHA